MEAESQAVSRRSCRMLRQVLHFAGVLVALCFWPLCLDKSERLSSFK